MIRVITFRALGRFRIASSAQVVSTLLTQRRHATTEAPPQAPYKTQHFRKALPSVAPDDAASPAFKFKSTIGGTCTDEGPAPLRPLTPLQKRQLQMKDKKAFSLTPAAVQRIKFLLSQKGPDEHGNNAVGVRIGVKRRGCSGYSYTVNYEWSHQPTKQPNDTIVVQDDVVVFVSGDALFYVIGTEMDYFVSPVEQKFTFRNPNEKGKCGCGESFTPFDA